MNGLHGRALRRCAISRAFIAACVAGSAFAAGVGVGAEVARAEQVKAVIEQHGDGRYIVFDDRGTHYVLEFERAE